MLELIKTKIGHDPRLNGLATLFDIRTTYSQSVLKEVKAFFGSQMFQTVIRLNVALKRAVSEGVSIIDFDKTSNGAKDYTALCYETLRLDGVKDPKNRMRHPFPFRFLQRGKVSCPAREDRKTNRAGYKGSDICSGIVGSERHLCRRDFNDWQINDESKLARGETGSGEADEVTSRQVPIQICC